ncbi:MAG: thioether cross-link-forming SCIFF peptide maturase [Negativicutes bacterium]|nr:thioether cross-link-forming SCIFF peptide maturase [Negativicutes bacterium]MDR3591850.1 thioether cross-link-forming SCIFF peptide maturase [Negativicutes bacterium]
MNIHRFTQNGLNIVLDVNSGAVHVLDQPAYDVLGIFTGDNDQEVLAVLADVYSEPVVTEILAELRLLMAEGALFAPPIDTPPVFDEKPHVKSLCLHVAHDCNLRCGYCFAGTGDFGHSRGLMPVEVAERAVDFVIANSGARRHCEIDFFGGEPLLNMDTVRHTVAYIRRREAETGKIFKLTLTTNAVLLDEDVVAYLNAENISMVLSLDGRREVHDRIRPGADGSGSYDEAYAGIKRLVDSRGGKNYYLRGTFTALNLDFAADVAAMADLGFDQLSVEPVVTKDADYALKEEHLPLLFAQYDELARHYLARRQAGRPYEFFHFNLDLAKGPCVAKRLSGCGAGHEYFAVTPEGDLYPCHQFVGREDYRLGDVFSGVKRPDVSSHFRQTHVLAKEACHDCWARFFCSGGCHANAELFHATIEKPYSLGCELQKKRLECALMIQAQLALGVRDDLA